MSIITDGTNTGAGRAVRVSANRMFVHAVNQSEELHATAQADGYILTSGEVDLTTETESAVFYMKNNGDRDYVATGLFLQSAVKGTNTAVMDVKIQANLTSVSFSTPVETAANTNLGSTKSLSADIFKGEEGGTVGGGFILSFVYLPAGVPLILPVNFRVPKGSSFAVVINSYTDTGSTGIRIASLGYLANASFV